MTAPVPDLGDRGVPEDLCRVVGWAMEKEPGDRPRSAAELGGALQELERGAGRPVTDMRLREPRAAEEVASDETITVPTPPEPLPVARRAERAREATKATRRPSRWIVLPVLVTVAGAVALVLRDGDGGSDTTTPPEESTITTVPLAALSGTVAISGSSTVEPITTRNVDTFTRLAPNVVITVDAPNTANGFQLFCDGETDINDASRRINAGEVADCDGGGIDFIELKIAEDAQGRPQFIYVNAAKANESAALEAFVDFYLTDDGLASVTEAGLVALDPREVEASRRIWDQRRTGFATLTP